MGNSISFFCQVKNSLALLPMFRCDGTLCLELGATLLESYAGIWLPEAHVELVPIIPVRKGTLSVSQMWACLLAGRGEPKCSRLNLPPHQPLLTTMKVIKRTAFYIVIGKGVYRVAFCSKHIVFEQWPSLKFGKLTLGWRNWNKLQGLLSACCLCRFCWWDFLNSRLRETRK